MNVKPLKFAQLSQDAQDQWEKNGTTDYKVRIQCCFNCPNWHCEREIDRNYAWNPCLTTRARGEGEFCTVKFDFWCPDYAGDMQERNLAWVEQWDEVERINE